MRRSCFLLVIVAFLLVNAAVAFQKSDRQAHRISILERTRTIGEGLAANDGSSGGSGSGSGSWGEGSHSSGSESGSGSSEEWDLLHHLGTMTPYYPQQNAESYTPPPETCEPVFYNLVARHGSRQPTGIKGYSSLVQSLKNVEILDPQFAWMNNWTDPFDANLAGELDLAGALEHFYMAKREMKNFPTLLNGTFSSHVYSVQSSIVVRTAVSAAAHMQGLFGGKGSPLLDGWDAFGSYSESDNEDYLLRFFASCQNYLTLQSTPNASLQANLYLSEVAAVGQQIMEKLNLTAEQWNISASDANNMWSACGYQISVFNQTDQWCTLFNETQAEVMEAYEDISEYYSHGYGYTLNYQIATELLNDFVSSFEAVINGSNPVGKARLRFGHAETVMPFVSLLGLFKDPEPLTANAPWLAQRQWRTSVLSPFATNVAMILYNCSGSFVIKTLVNEKETILPNCPKLYCPYESFVDGYATELSYNFTQLCTPAPSVKPTPTPSPSTPVQTPTPTNRRTETPSAPPSTSPSASPSHHEFTTKELAGIGAGGFLIGVIITFVCFVIFIRTSFVRKPPSYSLADM
eukprot:TRINITY_DN2948_c0_g1_i1.p1 TRINITY_DN2948_c0_g1~~TRINITY_DN2948_c0_g1_i1.p1  ORF type:complete len:576 (-),score=91.67 TRINITY_DN2948_c0_g1_i1:50-1777(-)